MTAAKLADLNADGWLDLILTRASADGSGTVLHFKNSAVFSDTTGLQRDRFTLPRATGVALQLPTLGLSVRDVDD